MKFVYDDGGRSEYFRASDVGDCVVRAISIATEQDYKEVYDSISEMMGVGKSPRNGVSKKIYKKYMKSLDWEWVPTMFIGQGCKVHLNENELPKQGRLLVRVSKHLTTVIDGTLYDTYDCTRNGKRCVYGYYTQKIDNNIYYEDGSIKWDEKDRELAARFSGSIDMWNYENALSELEDEFEVDEQIVEIET